MKKALLIAALALTNLQGYSQGSAGLVAHWTFDGNAKDVTGNGHDGTLHNVTVTSGKNGLPNTGYYFTGDPVNYSYIDVPYISDLNLTTYSICATINVKGFYTGNCQSNTIFIRSAQNVDGNYGLIFSDNDYDGGNCSAFDSTKDVFEALAGQNSPAVGSWQYTPTIKENVWISVIATFNGTSAKIYVNGILKSSATGSPLYTIGSSTDGISIGANHFGSFGAYPYPFKGIIDDIRLYNRVLADSEIQQYDTATILSVPSIANNVSSMDIYPNPTKDFLNIQGLFLINKPIEIVIYNQIGQQVTHFTSQVNNEINISNLNAGVYFIKLKSEEYTITKKFIKQ